MNMQRRLRIVVVMAVVSALLFGCGNSSKEADQTQRIKELEAQVQELEQSKEQPEETGDEAVNEQEDETAENTVTQNWYVYECNSKLLDFKPKLVEHPNDGKKYPAIDTFCIQLDDVVFDVSKDMPITVQGFIDKLTQSGAEGDAYSFWLDDGNEEYTTERLADGSVEILVAKNGYGYCSVTFENPETKPASLSTFITKDLNIRPAKPYDVNGEGKTKPIQEALTCSCFDDKEWNNYMNDMNSRNKYAVQNIWYTGGIRYDGEMYYGGKLKYSDAPAFYEKMGLTEVDLEANRSAKTDGHYYLREEYIKDIVKYEGAPLITGYIMPHDRYEEYDVMAVVNYWCSFDMKSQECIYASTGIDIGSQFIEEWDIENGMYLEKGHEPAVYDFSSNPGDIDYDAFMDKETSFDALTGPYVLMSNDDADFFAENIIKDAYPDKEVKLLSRQSMDTEGYVGWILYKFSLDDNEEAIFCTNILTGVCRYGLDSSKVEEEYVVFDHTYDNRGF